MNFLKKEKKNLSQLCKFDCYFLVLSAVPQLLYKLPVTLFIFILFYFIFSLSDIEIQRETIVSMIVFNYYVPVIQGNLKPPIKWEFNADL